MLGRRQFLAAGMASALLQRAQARPASAAATPVILDTDIGDDIDDTWALLMLLREPSLDLKLAVGDFGNPLYRARLLAQ